MNNYKHRIEFAIKELQAGKLIILTDNPDRENEGDLIFPAQNITAEIMNFIIRNSSGIVCLSLLEEKVKQLGLKFMVPINENNSTHNTPFTVSIDAKNGITTGVSASDRVRTILTAIDEKSTANDIATPGHIFPLQARKYGVLERAGHTEGSIDIVRLAGFKPEAILCEIMNEDGSMARGQSLKNFAEKYQITTLSISDIVNYRLAHENLIEETSVNLPLEEYGEFEVSAVRDIISGSETLVLSRPGKNTPEPTIVRIHSSCCTGDIFRSLKCDCYQQLQYSLKMINENGGILIYLPQEGRGIGLFNKINAYKLQNQGKNTIEANLKLGLPHDLREYHIAANILRNRNINSIKLITNNPLKASELKKFGINNIEIIPTPLFQTNYNYEYLQTKIDKLGHIFKNLAEDNI